MREVPYGATLAGPPSPESPRLVRLSLAARRRLHNPGVAARSAAAAAAAEATSTAVTATTAPPVVVALGSKSGAIALRPSEP